MQATLLGLSTAIILALIAALVGPHFVDWSQYRATFEREATQLAGMPVRIAGPIDVRILPTPTLTLGRVEFGSVSQPHAKVRELHAELALGSLMRGAVRASELRVAGPELSIGVAANGRADLPVLRVGFDPEQFLIDKLAIDDGRLVFADAASGTTVSLQGLWFNGDLRSLLGPAKGEGGFIAAGERYGYRLATSRVGDDGSVKLRLALDPSDRPLAIEADGALRLEDSSPRFEGTVTLARPAVAGGDGRGTVAVPWRASAKVKAAPSHALFEQLEYSYGPEARALKLTGTAEFRFGKEPRFDSVLSARQIDLDRAMALPDASGRLPLAALKAFIEPLAASYRPRFPVRLGIGVDAVTLAGGTLQNMRGDIKLDNDGWDIETLEFRAPGFAQIRLSGKVAAAPQGVTFKGPAQIEASDPKLFAAWLEGRADAVQHQAGLLRASGDLAIGPQEFAVERLKLEFDRKTVEGRLAYVANGARPPRLDAELKAGELDIDGMLAFARAALDGSAIERPREVALTVDIGRASLAGVAVKGVSGTFKLDPAGLTFDRVRIADLADAAFNLNGRMEGALDAPRGTVTFDIDARGLDGTVAVLTKYWPEAADLLRQAAAKIVPLKTRATLGIEPVSATDPRGNSKVTLALDGTAGTLRMKIGAEAAGDLGALRLPVFRLDGQVTATDGSALTALLGLDRALNVDKRAGTLSVAVRSAAGSDARVDVKLNAGGLAASASGTARLFDAKGFATAVDLTMQAADMSPLRRGALTQPTALLPVAMRARLTASANEVALESISGAVGGSPVRGKLVLGLGTSKRIEGQIDADTIEVPALIAMAVGMPRSVARADAPAWAGDPFGDGALDGLEGRIDFTAGRVGLTPVLVARQTRGTVRLGAGEIAIELAEGTLANGRATGQLILRRGADGLAARGKFSLLGGDAAQLLPSDGKAAVLGRVALQAEVEGSGLSPASLIGSLAGAGTITLEDAQLAGLDPKAFNAAIRAVEQGAAIDAPRIREIVTTVLDGGALAVPRLDAAVTVNAGQARIAPTTVLGQGADLSFAANADLADATLDARLTLSGPMITEGSSAIRPEILVTLKGPYAAPKRTVDASTLSGWLMLRSVERQAKQIDAMEAQRREAERREAEQRREAERRDAERRDAEARAVTSTIPAAFPAPPAIAEEAPAPPAAATPRVIRPHAPSRTPAPGAEPAPALPPPLNIGPAPGAAKSNRLPRPAGSAAAQNPPPQAAPPPAPRSALETLFGIQR
ncbi:MAG: AsmA family protein [Alphaproteobacteria bacterium]|nr:MAG: AsmA family protein [Alphaproteobacteria bacterium]